MEIPSVKAACPFRQIEVQGKIDALEKQIINLRCLAVAFQNNRQQSDQLQNELAELEAEQLALKRRLRKLQLNQIRQKNARENLKRQKQEFANESDSLSVSSSSRSTEEREDSSLNSSTMSPFPIQTTASLSARMLPEVVSTGSEEEFLKFLQFSVCTVREPQLVGFLQEVLCVRSQSLKSKTSH
jgi:hypothetical protein